MNCYFKIFGLVESLLHNGKIALDAVRASLLQTKKTRFEEREFKVSHW